MMQMNHVRLLVQDVHRSYQFYQEALGLESLQAPEGGLASLKCQTMTITLVELAAFAAALGFSEHNCGTGCVTLQFNTRDVQAAVARALAAGAQLVTPARRTRWDTLSAFLRDPDGVLIEIFRDISGETSELKLPKAG
jgi:catechol 2,3-dioxygenase-like lactoylglutathione lyase family enzyme